MQLRLIAPWLILLGACSSGGTTPPTGSEPQVVPDFLLTNVNTTSQPQGDISPRDSLGLITAWYFANGAT